MSDRIWSKAALCYLAPFYGDPVWYFVQVNYNWRSLGNIRLDFFVERKVFLF